MKVLVPVFVLLLSVGFYSCSKEKSYEIPGEPDPIPGTTLLGKWNFIHLGVEMEAYTSMSEAGNRIETVTRYTDTTTQNAGGITIEASSITGEHAYTIDTYAYSKFIINGVETDGIPPMPLKAEIKTEAFTAPYAKISDDSLYFPQGAIFAAPSDPAAPALPPSEPTGVKYLIRSDTLFMYASQVQEIQRDANTEVKAKGNIVTVYKKQQ